MLHTSFDWSGSPEGFVFWDNISKQMLEYAMLIDEVRKYDKEIAKYLTKEIFTDVDPETISICGDLNDVVFWEWTKIPSKQWGILATKLNKH
jgi:hypothetical protein